ncbi:MAG: DUF134 domain-containing protein [Candidatus Alkanophagales archaeon]
MPRRRCRFVGFQPGFRCFAPVGAATGEVVLRVEELESLRLKDLLGLDQSEAAREMGVSQPTFHRILKEARRKVADALVNGKVLRIEGGDYVLKPEARTAAPPPPPPPPPAPPPPHPHRHRHRGPPWRHP